MFRENRKYLATFSLFGIILILLTHIIRPYLVGSTNSSTFIFGILPNFGAAFSLPFVGVGLFSRSLKVDSINIFKKINFLYIISFCVSGLIVWEYLQKILWNYPIDMNDIFASLVGGIIAFIIYSIFIKEFKNNL
jgi:hypothetical protein